MTAHEGDYTEDNLIQQPAILRFHDLGWEVADCFEEKCGVQGTLGRETRAEVVLVSKLRPALERLNPEASAEAIDLAVEELTRDRSAQSLPRLTGRSTSSSKTVSRSPSRPGKGMREGKTAERWSRRSG